MLVKLEESLNLLSKTIGMAGISAKTSGFSTSAIGNRFCNASSCSFCRIGSGSTSLSQTSSKLLACLLTFLPYSLRTELMWVPEGVAEYLESRFLTIFWLILATVVFYKQGSYILERSLRLYFGYPFSSNSITPLMNICLSILVRMWSQPKFANWIKSLSLSSIEFLQHQARIE